MVAVIARFEGQAEAFEGIARALVAKVTADEPGAFLLKLVRAKKDPNSFDFMELYATREDLKAHGETDHFRAAFAEMKALLAADPVIEVLDEVA